MAHIFANMIGEYSTTTGTGVLDLNVGVIFGHRLFDDKMDLNDTCFIRTKMGADFEVALATFSPGSPDQITRSIILDSTNGGAAVSWGAGTKEIVLVHPAEALRGRKGADIAAATTLDLDDATGDVIDVTGNTTINGITLTEGREVTVRFTGIPTVNNGATLVLPGNVNRTAAVGDFATFRGYAAGVVRCVNWQRAIIPMFLAYNSAEETNATGDGTAITIDFDIEVMDRASNFAADVFTATVPGPHDFVGSIFLTGINAGTHVIACNLAASNRTAHLISETVTKASGCFPVGVLGLDMDAGDTASVTLNGAGGAKTIDVFGSGNLATYLSGGLRE